ncbi:MAG TPA: type II secretion system protein M [Porticoccus sp.]|nr:type II secretion system protein M [Porticoccus sp.]
MMTMITDSALFKQLAERYALFSVRDQWAIKLLAAFFAVMVLFSSVLIPASDYKAEAEAHYRSSLDSLNWMQVNRIYFSESNALHAQRDPGQSLLGLANKTAKGYQLSFKRYQPVGDSGLSLWLDDVPFNKVILWLERLDKKHGIRVKEIAVDRQQKKGLVSVRLVLQG